MDGPGTGRRIVASFGGEGSAAAMADELVRRGVDPTAIRVDHLHDLAIVGRGEQRDEAKHLTVAVAPGLGRTDQLLPGWLWAAVGFVVGFVLFSIAGLFVELGDLTRLASAAVVGICGGLGGAAVGVVYGLARGPELAGAGRDAPRTSVLSLPAAALGREEALIDVLSTGPVPSIWIVPAGGDHLEDVTAGTSDHPGATPDRPGTAAGARPADQSGGTASPGRATSRSASRRR